MIIDSILVLASAIVKNRRGEVLLLQRSKNHSFPNHWQLTEGKLKNDEAPETALKREIQEEISQTASKLKLESASYIGLTAKGQKYLAFRLAYSVQLFSNDIKLSEEHKNFGWFSKTKALKLKLLPGTKEILQKR